eukprot:4572124-Pyramimonas_sp.AAC.1
MYLHCTFTVPLLYFNGTFTVPLLQGAAWVGTAPVDPFETTNSHAYGKHKKHEFQARSASADPR